MGLTIIPIRLSGDTLFTSYSIQPALDSGLHLNSTTGVISGTYHGPVKQGTYQITGTNQFGSHSDPVIFMFKGCILFLF